MAIKGHFIPSIDNAEIEKQKQPPGTIRKRLFSL
jgi:hypothetical protein